MKKLKIDGHFNFESGQALLIIIMLLATSLTVFLANSFLSKTDVQITKLEEDSQKALAAAEAGIETALRQGSVSNIGTLPGLSEFSGNVQVSQDVLRSTFVSPSLSKDEQYTYYLADYQEGSPPSFGPSYGGNLTLFYGTESSCTLNSLEITLLYGTSPNYQVKRFIADYGNRLATDNDDISTAGGGTIEDTSFNCRTNPINIAAYANAKILIVRTLFAGTRIGVQGVGDLKSQGKVVVSQVQTKTGVNKKVQLFQAYPQIPAEFFTTTF